MKNKKLNCKNIKVAMSDDDNDDNATTATTSTWHMA